MSVVIPTYNSSRTVRTICEQVLHAEPNAEVIIVDDNSPDGTGMIADEIAANNPKVRVVHRQRKLGVASAVYDGVLCASAEKVVTMDADLHHSASILPQMRELLNSGYDLVIASRYIEGSRFVCSSVLRFVLNRLGNKFAGALIRLPVKDFTHGFRGYSKRVFLQSFDKSQLGLQQLSDGSYNLLVLDNAWRLGYRIVEIPCSSTHSGKSNAGIAFRYLKIVVLVGFGRNRPRSTKSQSRSNISIRV
jgi:dolichol-phosphate mannosyltransferase